MNKQVEQWLEDVKLTDGEIANIFAEQDTIIKDTLENRARWLESTKKHGGRVRGLLEAQLQKILDDPRTAVIVGEIKEIPCGAADTQNYAADFIGISWERSAPFFREFMLAGYKPVIKTKEERK